MRQIADLNKDRAILEEKLLNAEQKREDVKTKFEQEILAMKD